MIIVIVFFPDSAGNLIPYQLVAYKFDGVPEHTVLVRPHGNSKKDKPYTDHIQILDQELLRRSLAMHTITQSNDALVKSGELYNQVT